MLSPSDIVVRPAGLSERLAEAKSDAPAHPEPTPTTMAERFAPGGQKPEVATRGVAEPLAVPGLALQPARMAMANRGLVLAALIVSLVPTAAILVLAWQGAIKLPGAPAAAVIVDYSQIAESQRASLAALPVIPTPAAVEIEVRPEVALTAPTRIEAKPGEETALDIGVNSDAALPARSVIAIRGLPEGAALTQGRPYDSSEWNVRPDQIGDLKLRLPETASGHAELRIEIMAADGTMLAGATTRLEIAPDPRAALIVRADEKDRIVDLIEHGQKMIDVGYLAGARAYYKRAAEAGSGEAALRLGATYDPDFIDEIGALGVKADPEEARAWYEHARRLGVEGAEEKLKALKEGWTDRDRPSQAAEAEPDQPVQAAEERAANLAASDAGTAAPAPSTTTSAPLPAGETEWVSMANYANVRAAPSTTADTLRVAEKGAKLRVTGRKGNWVQVADPQTAEVGWVYSRFLETAE
jgi:hypothetical protein